MHHLTRNTDRRGPTVLARHQHHIVVAVRAVSGEVVRLQML